MCFEGSKVGGLEFNLHSFGRPTRFRKCIETVERSVLYSEKYLSEAAVRQDMYAIAGDLREQRAHSGESVAVKISNILSGMCS